MARNNRSLDQYQAGSDLIQSFGTSSLKKKGGSSFTPEQENALKFQASTGSQIAQPGSPELSDNGDIIYRPGALTNSQDAVLNPDHKAGFGEKVNNFFGQQDTGGTGSTGDTGSGMNYSALSSGLKNVFANIGQKKETAPISLFNPQQAMPTTDLNQFATQPQQQPQVDPQLQALLAQLRANPNLKY